MQTNGIWEIYGDERDTTFVELVNIPVLELEGVRVEGVELHLKDKTNTAATAYFFDRHIERNMLVMLDDSHIPYKESRVWYLDGVGSFKYKVLELLGTDTEGCIREFLDAIKLKINGDI